MKVSRKLGNVPVTETKTVDQYDYKKVVQLKYLGTVATQKNECQTQIH